MDLKQLKRHVDALPPEARQQVTDFSAFLSTRHQRPLVPKRSGKSTMAEEPFVGLWEDREDLRDSTTWVRDVCQRE
jgi:hypothetical protein